MAPEGDRGEIGPKPLPLLFAASMSIVTDATLASASMAASKAFLLLFAARESLHAHVRIVMRKVAIAVPKTMATAVPDPVRVLSIAMQTSPPAESVVQYMPSAHELAVAVVEAHVLEPVVYQQAVVGVVE